MYRFMQHLDTTRTVSEVPHWQIKSKWYPPLDTIRGVLMSLLFVLLFSVWSVGNTTCCPRDPHPGPSPLSGVQHTSAPQCWSSAPLPAHLPGAAGKSQRRMSSSFSWTVSKSTVVSLQEHRDEHLTTIPQEVCLSFIKIIQEVLGSPPDLDLLKLICNFLLAVHPPTNTYVCHTPSSFYFSLHIGKEAAPPRTPPTPPSAVNFGVVFSSVGQMGSCTRRRCSPSCTWDTPTVGGNLPAVPWCHCLQPFSPRPPRKVRLLLWP